MALFGRTAARFLGSPRPCGALATALLASLALAAGCDPEWPEVTAGAGGMASGPAPASPAAEQEPPTPPSACELRGEPSLARRGVDAPSGPLALGRWGDDDVVIVADADENALFVVDAATLELRSITLLPSRPHHLRILNDGRVAVTLRDDNRLALFAPRGRSEQGLALLCDEAVVREPLSLAERPGELLVVGGAGAELAVLDASSLAVKVRHELGREPRGLVLSRDGELAWISHMVGGLVSRVQLDPSPSEESAVTAIVTHRASSATDEPSRSAQGFAIALHRDDVQGDRLVVPQISSLDAELLVGASTYAGLSDAGFFVPWVATVHERTGLPLAHPSESRRRWKARCMLPRAAITQDDRLWVACADRGTVLELDARFVDPMTAAYQEYRFHEGLSGIALGEDRALFAWSEHARVLSRLDTGDRQGAALPLELLLPRRPDSAWTDELVRGRSLFFATRDHRLTTHGAACESCHPDGRDDGLMWVDGTATRSLAGRLDGETHLGWHGEHASLQERIESTADRLGGTGFQGTQGRDDLLAMGAYMRSMRPAPPPLAHEAADAASIRRGETLFRETLSCNGCHPDGGADGATLQLKLVADAGPNAIVNAFDAPTLHHMDAAGPFFHDQRYASLEEVFSDPEDPMDLTSSLSEAERADLAAYVLALPHGVVVEASGSPIATRSLDASGSAYAGVFGSRPEPTRSSQDARHQAQRQLLGEPSIIPLSEIVEVDLPYGPEQLPSTWYGPLLFTYGQDAAGDLILLESHYREAVLTGAQQPESFVVPQLQLSAHPEPAMSIVSCRLGEQHWQWTDRRTYAVRCDGSEVSQGSLQRLAEGVYGFQMEYDGHPTLMIVADGDQFFDHGPMFNAGGARRAGDGSVALMALPLVPGEVAQIVADASDIKLTRAGLAHPGGVIANVVWTDAEREPTITVGRLSTF